MDCKSDLTNLRSLFELLDPNTDKNLQKNSQSSCLSFIEFLSICRFWLEAHFFLTIILIDLKACHLLPSSKTLHEFLEKVSQFFLQSFFDNEDQ